MSENSKIEWTDHTFNPWEGCQKVGPGCDHCYAEVRNARFAGGTSINWGPGAPRRRTSPTNWAKPGKWNQRAGIMQHAWEIGVGLHGGDEAACIAAGFTKPQRPKVFCASLADVFDNAVDPLWRDDLWQLIWDTPNLDWLLLTKRISNVPAMLPEEWGNGMIDHWPHVWLGATIVNQAEADRDIQKLIEVPAVRRFLSMEPLLGAANIAKWLDPWTCSNCQHHGSDNDSGPCKCADCDIESVYDESIGSDRCPQCGKDNGTSNDVGPSCPNCKQSGSWERDNGFKFDSSEKKNIDWVIVGGESGPKARPMHPDWARSLRDQCQAAGVPFLFKQFGEWGPHQAVPGGDEGGDIRRGHVRYLQGDGREPDGHFRKGDAAVARVGKKAAGRLLDGVTHDGFPE